MRKNALIYVAGHKGLVGSALVRKLRAEGYTNLIARTHDELDLERQMDVEVFFQEERPEYVFLAAAKVGGILANSRFPAEFIYSNLTVQANVIHASWKTGVKRLLFLGSSCVYPRECPQPVKEDYLLTGPLEPTNQPYAIAKIAGIIQCESYNRQYGTNFIAVMPTNLYGPNDNFDLEASHVLAAVIRKFHLAKLASKGNRQAIERDEETHGPIPEDIKRNLLDVTSTDNLQGSASGEYSGQASSRVVTLWGTGSPRREFLHVDDLADACIFIMNLPENSFRSLRTSYPLPLINIGWGRDLSISELGLLIRDVVDFDGELTFDTTKPDGTPRKVLDVSRLTELGWKPKIPLKEGIRETYSWYLKQSLSQVKL